MTKNEIELRIRAMREELENGITVKGRVDIADIVFCREMTEEEKVDSLAEVFYYKTKSHRDTYYKQMSHDEDEFACGLEDAYNDYAQIVYDARYKCHERLYSESRNHRYDDLFPPIRIARESEEKREMLFLNIRTNLVSDED